ncbi:MAG: hypothetical protein ACLQUW_08975 [Desulfobaccales bacterium]
MTIRKVFSVGLVIIFLALPSAVSGEGFGFKPGLEPDGFRGIKWGTDISILRGMELVEDDGLDKFYKNKEDNMMIGAAQLSEIIYVFWDGKFASILIQTNGQKNYGHLKDACFEKFGKGMRTDADQRSDIEYYIWEGAMTGIDLKYEKVKDVGSLYIFSLDVKRKQATWGKQKLEKGQEQERDQLERPAYVRDRTFTVT